MPPTDARHQQLKEKLLSLRDELSGKVPEKLVPNRQDDHEVGGDEDEQPLNEMLQAIASNRNRSRELTLIRVNRALKKLAEAPDDYGLCETCEEEIDERRLDALPYAELCTECQGKRDGPRGAATRKKLTDYI